MRLQFSTHDTLTGLFNRAFFDSQLARLRRAHDYPLTVIVCDVDWLKSTNDRLGHNAGDRLLQTVATVLQEAFREGDIVARIGGDEFAAVLPGTDALVAGEVLLRIRGRLVAYNATRPDNPIQVSLGAATASNSIELGEALKQADYQMYMEKQHRGQGLGDESSWTMKPDYLPPLRSLGIKGT